MRRAINMNIYLQTHYRKKKSFIIVIRPVKENIMDVCVVVNDHMLSPGYHYYICCDIFVEVIIENTTVYNKIMPQRQRNQNYILTNRKLCDWHVITPISLK